MQAVYRLAKRIAGFEFFSWMLLAKARGATAVSFDLRSPKTSKWDLPAVLRRCESILLPGPALAGLEACVGWEGEQFGDTHVTHLVNHVRAGGAIDWLRSVLPAANERYTVTLRQTARRPERNSNLEAWRTFAEEIGARVIEDYDVQPIGLHERVALYAGAAMNFFVTNGPMHLCSLTPYPMRCFVGPAAEGSLANIGVDRGAQLPWCGPDQRLVWAADELSALRREFDVMGGRPWVA